MFITDSAITAVCATLNSVRTVNGKPGRDVAARIFGLRQQGRVKEVQLEIERLPRVVQHDLHKATSGEVGVPAPQPTIVWPTAQIKIAA
jgi:hypothetical protein